MRALVFALCLLLGLQSQAEQHPLCKAERPSLDSLIGHLREDARRQETSLTSLLRFARYQALLPEVNGKATRDRDRNLTLSNGKSGISTDIDQDAGVSYSLTLAWNLAELHHNSQTLRLHWEIEEVLEKETKAVDLAVELYQRWVQLREKLCTGEVSASTGLELRALEHRLNSLSRGWFLDWETIKKPAPSE